MPEDKTAYLDELESGREVLIVDASGATSVATVGRLKVEVRPMLFIEASIGDTVGAVFVQMRNHMPHSSDGSPVSVAALKEGDTIRAEHRWPLLWYAHCEDIQEGYYE